MLSLIRHFGMVMYRQPHTTNARNPFWLFPYRIQEKRYSGSIGLDGSASTRMRFILFSSLLLLASQRCRAARTRLRRRRAASDSFTGTSGCDLNGNNNTTRTATEESVQVNPCMFCDEVPRRCTTLNREDRFSFIHISKSGGASWIDELNKMKLGEVFPYKHTGKEWYLYYQKRKEQKLDQSLATHHLTSLRSPRHHMWSMWAECRWDTWGVHTTKNTTFPRSGTNTTEDVRDFTKWVDHYVNDDFQLINGTYKSHYGGCYHPAYVQNDKVDLFRDNSCQC